MNRPVVLTAFFLLAFAAFTSHGYAQEENAPAFFSTLNDVPLMPGLLEQPEESTVFDKAQGRIAESMAIAPGLSAQQVGEFYSRTLPQLGWQEMGAGHYVREDEQLFVSVEQDSGQSFVRIMVEPRPDAP